MVNCLPTRVFCQLPGRTYGVDLSMLSPHQILASDARHGPVYILDVVKGHATPLSYRWDDFWTLHCTMLPFGHYVKNGINVITQDSTQEYGTLDIHTGTKNVSATGLPYLNYIGYLEQQSMLLFWDIYERVFHVVHWPSNTHFPPFSVEHLTPHMDSCGCHVTVVSKLQGKGGKDFLAIFEAELAIQHCPYANLLDMRMEVHLFEASVKQHVWNLHDVFRVDLPVGFYSGIFALDHILLVYQHEQMWGLDLNDKGKKLFSMTFPGLIRSVGRIPHPSTTCLVSVYQNNIIYQFTV